MNITKPIQNTRTNEIEISSAFAAIEQSLAMIQFDTQGNVLWANNNFAKTMGYEAWEMPGLKHSQFCLPEFANSPEYREFWDNLRSGQTFQKKILRVTKDQRLLWFEATYTPVYNSEGYVQGVIKVATDITKRENAVSELTRELQQMAEGLLKRADEGVSSGQEIESSIKQAVKETNDNMQVLQLLERKAESVKKLTDKIRSIADYTNLLALNAAIEAAHAKEYGRGFNVVANEVRKLASQTEEATKEVNSDLESITVQVEEIVKGMKNSQTIIIDGQTLVNKAVEEFTGIGQAADQLDRQAKTLGDVI
jgi:PAS domain S-box-containing protein